MPRLIQLRNNSTRRVALVGEPHVRLLDAFDSVYGLAQAAVTMGVKLADLIRRHATGASLDYDAIYTGQSEWRLLTPIDHPAEPARCLVSGTGLTHLGSARDRQAMHTAAAEDLTDSMKMFRWGLDGGRPAAGQIGTAPEWFYKGTGTILRAHGEPLLVPPYAEDGGEEAEIAGVYMIDPNGRPRRIGLASGNEFSDHRFEKRNYLYLAGSKIRTCALGPELVIDADFGNVAGVATIERNGAVVWTTEVRTGADAMCHSRQNIEHHHFKFETHRRPGDVHVHYFGAPKLSFGEGVQLVDGDEMVVRFDGFGRALRNPVRMDRSADVLVTVQAL
jgi:hypothetical protein